MLNRHLAMTINGNEIKKLKPADIEQLIKDPFLAFSANNSISTISFLDAKAKQIERKILSVAKLEKQFEVITSMPAIGNILGLTIMLEVDDIGRFPAPGNYASYCRCVKSLKTSNKKKKGKGNEKNGNKYLSWAYVEAAHMIGRKGHEI